MPFVDMGKPVFNVEYDTKKAKKILDLSLKHTKGKFNTIIKYEELDCKYKQDYNGIGIP